ncbi:MAG: tRNA 2-thiouridine(34) synthase MnmA [Candidatus Ancillula sp.]|jgi:tRNA-specific 2-thiouridylase|nr:tRNA 2-thiouridine(34) synthase MnmA [Candidatus Ancillula sp.]
MKILVGMSGGVDSSLAAALCVEEGHQVMGVTMELTRKEQINAPGFIDHGSIEEANDAKCVAEKIGIPFETWDMSELYRDKVVKEFINAYSRGETPNPCVSCNQNVKFSALVAKAREKGFDMVATGHYARVLREGDDGYQGSGMPELHRGVNASKDQSYFVASMPPNVVQFCYFPLGNFFDKADVRTEAKFREFATHDKKDSSDICFLAKNAKTEFLGANLGKDFAGEIVDEEGNVLGEHQGFWNFTVGQRQGLDIKTPRKDGRPRYVLSTDPTTRQVVVGPKEMLLKQEVRCNEVKVFGDLPEKFTALAQIRAHGKSILADFELNGDDLIVRAQGHGAFEAVARGQSLVAYDVERNSRVLLKSTLQ